MIRTLKHMKILTTLALTAALYVGHFGLSVAAETKPAKSPDRVERQKSVQVTVVGAVNSPGVFTIPGKEKYTIDDLLKACGGALEGAQLRSVKISRTASDGSGRTTNYIVNTEKGGGQFVLQADDVVILYQTYF